MSIRIAAKHVIVAPLVAIAVFGFTRATPCSAKPPTSAPAASGPAADKPRLAVLDFSVGEDIKPAHGQLAARGHRRRPIVSASDAGLSS